LLAPARRVADASPQGRESLTDKATSAMKPDSEKSYVVRWLY